MQIPINVLMKASIEQLGKVKGKLVPVLFLREHHSM
jgi:hypothetical protein